MSSAARSTSRARSAPTAGAPSSRARKRPTGPPLPKPAPVTRRCRWRAATRLRRQARSDVLARLIAEERVDLVHARSRWPAWLAFHAAQRTGRPFVTTFHGALLHGLAGKAALQRDHDAGRPRHRGLGFHRPAHNRDLRRRARQDQEHPARRGPRLLRPRARGHRAHRRAACRVAGAGRPAGGDAAGAAHGAEGASRPPRRADAGRGGRLLRSGRPLGSGARGLSRPHRAADRGTGHGAHRPARRPVPRHVSGLHAG